MNEVIIAQILESLNRIERKVDDHHATFSQQLAKHMADEDEEIAALNATAQENRDKSEARHTALMLSISSYMEKSIAIETAFLKREDGQTDFHGHYDDHDQRKRMSDKVGKWRDDAVGNVVKVSTLSALAWLFYTLWEALLRGPK